MQKHIGARQTFSYNILLPHLKRQTRGRPLFHTKNGKEDEASGSDACEAGRFRYLGYPVSNGSPKSRRDEKSKGCRELLCVDKIRQN